VVDGRIVVQGGRLKSADLEEIRVEANAATRRLRRAVGL